MDDTKTARDELEARRNWALALITELVGRVETPDGSPAFVSRTASTVIPFSRATVVRGLRR